MKLANQPKADRESLVAACVGIFLTGAFFLYNPEASFAQAVKRTSTTSIPNIKFKIYGKELYTNGPITKTTNKIYLSFKVTNNSTGMTYNKLNYAFSEMTLSNGRGYKVTASPGSAMFDVPINPGDSYISDSPINSFILGTPCSANTPSSPCYVQSVTTDFPIYAQVKMTVTGTTSKGQNVNYTTMVSDYIYAPNSSFQY